MIKSWLKNKISEIKFVLVVKWILELEYKEKHRMLTLAVRKFFNAISEDDILKIKDNKMFYLGKVLNEGEINLLKAETKVFLETKLWQVLKTDIRWQANKRMFEVSRTENDLIAGKIALFNLDVIKTVLEKISNFNH